MPQFNPEPSFKKSLNPKNEIQKANLPQSTGRKLFGKISPDLLGYGFGFSKEFPLQHLDHLDLFNFAFWVKSIPTMPHTGGIPAFRAMQGSGTKSVPPASHRCCRCSSHAASKSSRARPAIIFCPPIPVPSSKTVTGAGRSVIWPVMPLTFRWPEQVGFRSEVAPGLARPVRSPTPRARRVLPLRPAQKPARI